MSEITHQRLKVTIVQYAGDYDAAYRRLSEGGPEIYQAERYSVEFMGSIPHDVTVLCGVTPAPYDTVLPNGVRAIGAGLANGFDEQDLMPFLPACDRLILVTPLATFLKWASRNKVRTLLMMADSFPDGGFKRKIRNRLIARHLNSAEWVGNHQMPAARSLRRIGVDKSKIIPWDWPPSHSPRDYEARTLGTDRLKLAFVGAVSEAKGAGDLIRSLPDHFSLTLYGPLIDRMPERPNVTFAGTIPNAEVAGAMRDADAVVVPSRHEYPEGLPLTILEALATRTPLIVSDHPMFHLPDASVQFVGGNCASLRDAMIRLSKDPALYAELSRNSAATWDSLQVPVKFGEMISRWLNDDEDWLRAQVLKD